jgi:E3 ubiquitin-protein ligase listerin
MVKPSAVKAQASSSRIAVENFSFGSTAGSLTGFSVSPLSYLGEYPDASSISNPTTVVTFKNLFKKDSTTKTRALEDLNSTLSAATEIEDAIIDVWAAVYPRSSVETSRRVRQLAHIIQGQICVQAGKRIIKHLPTVVGPWLLGLYDNDKVVSLAAQEALNQAFTSPEKRQMLLQRYQSQILSQCSSVINDETPQTLSDERIVSPDEANAKYNRVLAAAIGLFAHMVNSLSEDEMKKCSEQYGNLMDDKKLWGLVSSEDPSVRRQVHLLLQASVQNPFTRPLQNSQTLSGSYVVKGLEADQKGTAVTFLDTLIALSQWEPTIWTTEWKSKKSPLHRLKHFVRSGSHNSSVEVYWSRLNAFLKALPSVVFSNQKDVEEFLQAFEKGINSKDEPKYTWNLGLYGFVSAVSLVSSYLDDEGSRLEIGRKFLEPILASFLNVRNPSISSKVVGDVIRIVVRMKSGKELLEQIIKDLGESVVSDLKSNLSEEAISQRAQRWGSIFVYLNSAKGDFGSADGILTKLISEAINNCKAQKGVAYGSASLLLELIKANKEFIASPTESSSQIRSFLQHDMPEIFVSRSATQFGQLLKLVNSTEEFFDFWLACFQSARSIPWDESRRLAYCSLIKSLPNSIPGSSSNSASAIYSTLDDLVVDILQSPPFSDSSESFLGVLLDLIPLYKEKKKEQSGIVQGIIKRIGTGSNISLVDALSFLQSINHQDSKIRSVLSTNEADQFFATLLDWSESGEDELRQLSTACIDRIIAQDYLAFTKSSDFVLLFQTELSKANDESLLVSTLIDLAKKLESRNNISSSTLAPDLNSWKESLEPFLDILPPMSSYITSPLHSAVLLVERAQEKDTTIQYDDQKWSTPFRIAIYTIEFLTQRESVNENLDPQVLASILELLTLTTIIANEDISFGVSRLGPNDELELTNFVSSSFKLISKIVEEIPNDSDTTYSNAGSNGVKICLQSLHDASVGRSANAYRHAMAYYHLLDEYFESHRTSMLAEEVSKEVMSLRKVSRVSPFQVIPYPLVYYNFLTKSQLATRWYNEMIADLTGPGALSDPNVTLDRLVLMAAMIQDQGKEFLSSAANQRIVLFIRGLVGWLGDESTPPSIVIVAQAIFRKFVPLLVEIYGDHWENVLIFIKNLWKGCPEAWDPENKNNEILLPLLCESLRLIRVLESLTSKPDCNEDLIEALEIHKSDLRQALLGLLMMERGMDDAKHLPLRIVNGFICRRLESGSLTNLVTDPKQMYPLLAAKSETIQTTTFNILHAKIPTLQEELSMEVALGDMVVARLPDELLSLIMDAPPLKDDALMDWLNVSIVPDYDEDIPSRLKSYLLSWVLVFDHFVNAVSVVQACIRYYIVLMIYSLTQSKVNILIASRMVIISSLYLISLSICLGIVKGNQKQSAKWM